MSVSKLLEVYKTEKESKNDLFRLSFLRAELLNRMYAEYPDFCTNKKVKYLLNEEVYFLRNSMRKNVKLAPVEITVPFTLYRYLVETEGDSYMLRSDLNLKEVGHINSILFFQAEYWEKLLMEYFNYRFAKEDAHYQIRSIMYHCFLIIQNELEIEGKLSLNPRPLDRVINDHKTRDSYKFIQSDLPFKETNEILFNALNTEMSPSLAVAGFVLNFEKGNKAYAIHYYEKLRSLIKEDSILTPLLNVVELEFLA